MPVFSIIDPGINGFRLTTESGVGVSTSDRTAQSTIYATPFRGNRIALHTGGDWACPASAQFSLALSGLTSGKNYDVFAYLNTGVPTLELSAAWTNDTTRADALALQDGILVKSGTTTRRYLGMLRTTGTTTTEDSGGGSTTQVGGKRFLWNAYNQVRRQMAVIDTTDVWTYKTDTVRQANGAAGNKVEYVTGDVATQVDAIVIAGVFVAGNSLRAAKAGVGVNSTTVISGLIGHGYNVNASNVGNTISGSYRGTAQLGYSYLAWCEKGADGTTCDFVGDNNAAQFGLQASIMG